MIRDLHVAGFLHHDLKLGNIVLQPASNEPKFIDFGTFVPLKEVCPFLNAQTSTHCVCPDPVCGPSTDVYQFGLVFVEILWPSSGPDVIWRSRRDTHFKASLESYLCTQCLDDLQVKGFNLMLQLLEEDPQKRITIPKILEHPFFQT